MKRKIWDIDVIFLDQRNKTSLLQLRIYPPIPLHIPSSPTNPQRSQNISNTSPTSPSYPSTSLLQHFPNIPSQLTILTIYHLPSTFIYIYLPPNPTIQSSTTKTTGLETYKITRYSSLHIIHHNSHSSHPFSSIISSPIPISPILPTQYHISYIPSPPLSTNPIPINHSPSNPSYTSHIPSHNTKNDTSKSPFSLPFSKKRKQDPERYRKKRNEMR